MTASRRFRCTRGPGNFDTLDLTTTGLLRFGDSSIVDMVGAIRYDGENGLVNIGR